MQWKKKTFKEEHLNAAEEEEHLGDESSEAEGDFAFCTFLYRWRRIVVWLQKRFQ